jgi:hypothetical protein
MYCLDSGSKTRERNVYSAPVRESRAGADMRDSEKDWESDWEDLEPTTNPFSTDAVDPLVYSMDDTSPELRAAAAYIPVAPKLTIRESAPLRPQPRQHSAWTPGGDEVHVVPVGQQPPLTSRLLKGVLSSVFVVAPLAAIALAVWVAYSLYR